jgi:hypothetical protein
MAIRAGLVSTHKVRQTRATEVLSGLGSLSDVLPLPNECGSSYTNILVPLLLDTIQSGTSTKESLIIMNNLIGHVPEKNIPSDLMDRLLSEMHAIDLGNLRGSIIVSILLRRLEPVPEDSDAEKQVLQNLLPVFSSKQPSSTSNSMNRYVLPPLFAARPSAIRQLLDILGSAVNGSTSETFPAWISVASLGVSLGDIQIQDLPKTELDAAIGHHDPDVRLKAFQLIAGSRDIANWSSLQLIQKSLTWNAVLPDSGCVSTHANLIY